MKKLLCSGLTALTMLFSMVGVVRAEGENVAETVAAPTITIENATVTVAGAADVTLYVAMGVDSATAVSHFAEYTAAISLANNTHDTVVLAYAKKGDNYSDTVKAEFKYVAPEQPTKPAAPTFDPAEGELEANTEITIAKGEADSIFVATGKTEAEATAFVKATADVKVTLTADTVIRAYAMKEGKYSDTVKAAYTVKASAPVVTKPAAPTISPVAGELEANTEITIAKGEADSIFVATGKTEAEATAFVKATADVKVTLTADTVIRAYAMKEGKCSDTVKAAYTVKASTPVVTKPVAPEFKLFKGEENDTVVVVLGESDSIFVAMGADSAAAVANGFVKYEQNDTIILTNDTVVLAYAMKNNEVSDTVKYEYKKSVSSAIERSELAGVNVYPNPNAGTFNVVVPERARVEIFGLNGAKVLSREVNAGVEAFSLTHSGIYFVRVMAGNKTAVKRVVVR